jgi:hypothetical protein
MPETSDYVKGDLYHAVIATPVPNSLFLTVEQDVTPLSRVVEGKEDSQAVHAEVFRHREGRCRLHVHAGPALAMPLLDLSLSLGQQSRRCVQPTLMDRDIA